MTWWCAPHICHVQPTARRSRRVPGAASRFQLRRNVRALASDASSLVSGVDGVTRGVSSVTPTAQKQPSLRKLQASQGKLQASQGKLKASHGNLQASQGELKTSRGKLKASHDKLVPVTPTAGGSTAAVVARTAVAARAAVADGAAFGFEEKSVRCDAPSGKGQCHVATCRGRPGIASRKMSVQSKHACHSEPKAKNPRLAIGVELRIFAALWMTPAFVQGLELAESTARSVSPCLLLKEAWVIRGWGRLPVMGGLVRH